MYPTFKRFLPVFVMILLVVTVFLPFVLDTNALSIEVEAGLVSIASDGKCSLIEAIENANDTNTGQPHLDCQAGDPDGKDDIQLATSSIYIVDAVNNDTAGDTGLPAISSDVTLNGIDTIIERDSNAIEDFRLFSIVDTGELTLSGVTIRNGLASDYPGAGIYVREGTLNLIDCALENNIADGFGGYGGAISSIGGTVDIENCVFQYNQGGRGGAIISSGVMTITDSTIQNNIGGPGGGIYIYPYFDTTSLLVSRSTFYKNYADDGGAIYAETTYGGKTQMDILNSTFSENEASSKGGVFYITTDPWQTTGEATLTIQKSTIMNNTASVGGIFYQTTYPETVSSFIFNSSILIGLNDGNDCYSENGTIYSQGYNLSNIGNCSTGPTDYIVNEPADVLELFLADNGGATQTFALVSNSEAIDKIPDGVLGCDAGNSVDQRGEIRAGGTANTGGFSCDIGAYEYHSPILPTDTPTSTNTPESIPTSTATVTNTPLMTSTSTPTSMYSSTPTITNTPTPTVTSTPTSNANAPYIITMPDCSSNSTATFTILGFNWPTNGDIALFWDTSVFQETIDTNQHSGSFTRIWTLNGLTNDTYTIRAISQYGSVATFDFTVPCGDPPTTPTNTPTPTVISTITPTSTPTVVPSAVEYYYYVPIVVK